MPEAPDEYASRRSLLWAVRKMVRRRARARLFRQRPRGLSPHSPAESITACGRRRVPRPAFTIAGSDLDPFTYAAHVFGCVRMCSDVFGCSGRVRTRCRYKRHNGHKYLRADARIRTADPFITRDAAVRVLCAGSADPSQIRVSHVSVHDPVLQRRATLVRPRARSNRSQHDS